MSAVKSADDTFKLVKDAAIVALILGAGYAIYEVYEDIEELGGIDNAVKKAARSYFGFKDSPCEPTPWYTWANPIGIVNNVINNSKCKKLTTAINTSNEEGSAAQDQIEDNLTNEAEGELSGDVNADSNLKFITDKLEPYRSSVDSRLFNEVVKIGAAIKLNYDNYKRTGNTVALLDGYQLDIGTTQEQYDLLKKTGVNYLIETEIQTRVGNFSDQEFIMQYIERFGPHFSPPRDHYGFYETKGPL